MPLKRIKRLEGGWGGGRSASPSDAWVTISNSFFTLVARSSSTSVPVCLALSYDRLLGNFFSSRSFSKLALSSFYVFSMVQVLHSHMSLCLH